MEKIILKINPTQAEKDAAFLEDGVILQATSTEIDLSLPEGKPYRKHFMKRMDRIGTQVYYLPEGSKQEDLYNAWLDLLATTQRELLARNGNLFSQYDLVDIIPQDEYDQLVADHKAAVDAAKAAREAEDLARKTAYEAQQAKEAEDLAAQIAADIAEAPSRTGDNLGRRIYCNTDKGHPGAYCAEITGPDAKYTFARNFLKKDQRITEEGLFIEQDVDKKGRKSQTFVLLVINGATPLLAKAEGNTMRRFHITEAEAQKLAKNLPTCSIAEQVEVYIDKSTGKYAWAYR